MLLKNALSFFLSVSTTEIGNTASLVLIIFVQKFKDDFTKDTFKIFRTSEFQAQKQSSTRYATLGTRKNSTPRPKMPMHTAPHTAPRMVAARRMPHAARHTPQVARRTPTVCGTLVAYLAFFCERAGPSFLYSSARSAYFA